jgi:hypothetical protein
LEHLLVLLVFFLLAFQKFRILIATEAELVHVILDVLVGLQVGEVTRLYVALVVRSLAGYSIFGTMDAAISSWSTSSGLVVFVG